MTTAFDERALRHWMADYLVTNIGCSPDDIDFDASMNDLGFGSRDAVVLSGELSELLGRRVSPVEFWQHPTINDLARFLSGSESDVERVVDPDRNSIDEPIAVIGLGCRYPGGIGGTNIGTSGAPSAVVAVTSGASAAASWIGEVTAEGGTTRLPTYIPRPSDALKELSTALVAPAGGARGLAAVPYDESPHGGATAAHTAILVSLTANGMSPRLAWPLVSVSKRRGREMVPSCHGHVHAHGR